MDNYGQLLHSLSIELLTIIELYKYWIIDIASPFNMKIVVQYVFNVCLISLQP